MPGVFSGIALSAISADSPTKPAVLVPTPAIGLMADGTSSTYTPGARYSGIGDSFLQRWQSWGDCRECEIEGLRCAGRSEGHGAAQRLESRRCCDDMTCARFQRREHVASLRIRLGALAAADLHVSHAERAAARARDSSLERRRRHREVDASDAQRPPLVSGNRDLQGT